MQLYTVQSCTLYRKTRPNMKRADARRLSDFNGAHGDLRGVGRLATPPASVESLPPELLLRLPDQLAVRRFRRGRRLDGACDRTERRWLARLLAWARPGRPVVDRSGGPPPASSRDRA